jgi:acyl carrier protein
MPASSQAKSSSGATTATSRNAELVLGANWPRPELTAPPLRLPGQPADIFQGIISHYVEPQRRPKLKDSGDSARLSEDLGLDSLDMMEVMLRVEDLLKIHVSDRELRHFRTLGEVRQFIDRNAPAAALSSG